MNIINEFFKHPEDTIAIYTKNEYVTYGELNAITNRVANNLNMLNNGDVIVVKSENCKEMIYIWIAAVKRGCAVCFLSNDHNDAVLNDIIKQTSAKIVFDNASLKQFVEESRVCSDRFCYLNNNAEKEICEITLTSGTGGTSQQIVKHSHENTLFSMKAGTDFIIKPEYGDVFYCTASLSFSYGIATELCIPLIYGAATLVLPRLSLIDTLQIIYEKNVSYFYTAPAFYRLALPHDIEHYFKNVKVSFSGGDFLPQQLKDKWKQKTGKNLTNIIGCAETQWIFACDDGTTPDGFLGKIIPPYEIFSVDEKMHVKTPFFEISTSDDVEIIDDFLKFNGRNDDLISTSMGKFNPYYIEHIIMNSGLVNDVFAKQFEKMGAKFIQLFCVGDNTLTDNLKTYCELNLPHFLVPAKITFVETLPRTVTGKAKRKFV